MQEGYIYKISYTNQTLLSTPLQHTSYTHPLIRTYTLTYFDIYLVTSLCRYWFLSRLAKCFTSHRCLSSCRVVCVCVSCVFCKNFSPATWPMMFVSRDHQTFRYIPTVLYVHVLFLPKKQGISYQHEALSTVYSQDSYMVYTPEQLNQELRYCIHFNLPFAN